MHYHIEKIIIISTLLFMFSCQNHNKTLTKPELSPTLDLDLEDAKQNFDAFMKVRSDANGKETLFYWQGSIYTHIIGERGKRVLGMKGFSVAKWIKTDTSRVLLTREVALYTNPKTGKIIEKWQSPFDKSADSVDVIHVWNDPVNQVFPYKVNDKKGVYSIPYQELDSNTVCFYADIFLAYPSALSREEFPLSSQSDLYQGAELFQFFVKKEDLADTSISDPPVSLSWTRLGQWLPWMKLGDRDGMLVYQCRGYKVLEGFEALPQDVKEYVREQKPTFEFAPNEYSSPNETSWTYFKKLQAKKH